MSSIRTGNLLYNLCIKFVKYCPSFIILVLLNLMLYFTYPIHYKQMIADKNKHFLREFF